MTLTTWHHLSRLAGVAALVVSAACENGTGENGLRVTQIVITAPDTVLSPTETMVLTAEARDSAGVAVPAPKLQWASADPSVATVDSAGAVTALGLGSTYLRARAAGVTDSIPLRVAQGFIAIGSNTGYVAALATTCAVRADSAGYCWGPGAISGTAAPAPLPLASLIEGGHHWARLDVDYSAACGITGAGVGYCWGDGHLGHLGDGGGASSNTPSPIAGGLTFQQVSIGLEHGCGVTTTGLGYCWGKNGGGPLGDSTSAPSRLSPVAVAGGHLWQQIEADGLTTCGLTTAGAVYCWGVNPEGYLGIDSTQSEIHFPAPLVAGGTFTGLSISGIHQCALAGGAVSCWGYNFDGELGLGTVDSVVHHNPVPLAGGLTLLSVTDGICGLAADGAAWCWGHGFGSLPARIPGSRKWAQLSGTCGLTTGGGAYCWSDTNPTPVRLRDP